MSSLTRIHTTGQVKRLDLDGSEAGSKQIALDPIRIGIGERAALHVVKWRLAKGRIDGVFRSFRDWVQLKNIEWT